MFFGKLLAHILAVLVAHTPEVAAVGTAAYAFNQTVAAGENVVAIVEKVED